VAFIERQKKRSRCGSLKERRENNQRPKDPGSLSEKKIVLRVTTGLPDFPWYMIPKNRKMYYMNKKNT
jgi:hypothetical protein